MTTPPGRFAKSSDAAGYIAMSVEGRSTIAGNAEEVLPSPLARIIEGGSTLMRYPGGKNAAGTYQRIINQIPPHEVYIEPFVGSGAILRHKRPARRSIAIDLCPGALATIVDRVPLGCDVLRANGIEFLENHPFDGSEFVYADPPFLPETRRGGRVYRFELTTADHESLLGILTGLPCGVMISGYWSELYARELRSWRSLTFEVMIRSGKTAEEWLWMNYPEPLELHDYRYLGSNFREREKFRRRQKRWTQRLRGMSPLERGAMFAAIAELR